MMPLTAPVFTREELHTVRLALQHAQNSAAAVSGLQGPTLGLMKISDAVKTALLKVDRVLAE